MMESSSFLPNVRRTTAKMASICVVSVFLLCCFAVTSNAAQGCDMWKAVGQSTNIPLQHKLQPTERLRWKLKDELLFSQSSGKINTGKEGDINLDGSLKLTNLNKAQAGKYTAEVHSSEGKQLANKETRLCVLDPVKKPNIKAECKDNKVTLICDGQQPGGVKYEWLQNNEIMKAINNKTSVTIQADTKKIDNFICKVSNEAVFVTSESFSHSCFKTDFFGLPEELFGIKSWIVLSGGGGIVLLLIIVVIFCFLRTKRSRKLRLKDEEELRLGWTHAEQHKHHPNHPPLPDHPPPHHPHRHQQQQQAPGNTGPRQSRSKQNRQQRARAPEPNGQPQPSPRRTMQTQKPTNDADDEQAPPLPQPRKKVPKAQVD